MDFIFCKVAITRESTRELNQWENGLERGCQSIQVRTERSEMKLEQMEQQKGVLKHDTAILK